MILLKVKLKKQSTFNRIVIGELDENVCVNKITKKSICVNIINIICNIDVTSG